MNPNAWAPALGLRLPSDEPAAPLILGLLILVLAAAPPILFVLDRWVGLDPARRDDLRRRYVSWLIMATALAVPVLLGAAWTILAVVALSLLGFREFAAATGLFRDKLMCLLVTAGILALAFAVADRWYRLFVALTPMSIVVITAVATSLDRPRGYIQRVALAIFGFLLFGTCLGHLGFMTSDAHYRSLILLLVVSVLLNDAFAYVLGAALGGPRLAPLTSPDRTVAGALGAIVLTTLLAAWLGGFVFTGGPLAAPLQRAALGLVISVGGLVGDLTVAAIRRDAGVPDARAALSGPGVLDRANGLLLSAPAMFHVVNHFTHFTGGG